MATPRTKTTPAAAPATTKPDRVWIELEQPRDDEHAARICELANRMLQRLNFDGEGPLHHLFFWDAKDQTYCYGGQMGYRGLSDRGEWFNLAYLGRPLATRSVDINSPELAAHPVAQANAASWPGGKKRRGSRGRNAPA